MATATLELVNPYSKYGFKRRPTYNEIIGLINENETITGQLPDRTATLYKASPEGSFFDGTDALELMKESRNRISQRQLQELLLKQNTTLRGLTYNLERLRQSSSSSSSSSTPVATGEDRGTLSAQVQADLQQRQQQLRDRQQQTGEAQAQELSRQSRLPVLQGFICESLTPIFNMIPSPASGSVFPVLPIRSRQQQEEEEEELIPDEEMLTAREGNIRRGEKPDMDKKQELIYFPLQAAVPDADVDDDLNVAFKVLDKFKNIKSNELVRNKKNRDEVFRTMVETGYITQPIFNQYLELVVQEKQAKGQENKEKIRNQMGRLYIDNIYNRFVAPISVTKGPETKAMARKPQYQEADTGARSSTG